MVKSKKVIHENGLFFDMRASELVFYPGDDVFLVFEACKLVVQLLDVYAHLLDVPL